MDYGVEPVVVHRDSLWWRRGRGAKEDAPRNGTRAHPSARVPGLHYAARVSASPSDVPDSPPDLRPQVQPPPARRTAVRYVAPFREGGSVPALVEGDDGGLWVVKLRGAAQGTRALVAELLVGRLAREVGLRAPEIALMTVDGALARTEPHQELAELLRKSVGVNAALAYLPSALGFDPAARAPVNGDEASLAVLFDAFVENVDRTARNPNLLWSAGALWLIDHGAALYWHHGWDGQIDGAERGFPLLRDHVLLPYADALPAAAARLAAALTDEALQRSVAGIPDDWLAPDSAHATRLRDAYAARLGLRRSALPRLLEDATRARAV